MKGIIIEKFYPLGVSLDVIIRIIQSQLIIRSDKLNIKLQRMNRIRRHMTIHRKRLEMSENLFELQVVPVVEDFEVVGVHAGVADLLEGWERWDWW